MLSISEAVEVREIVMRHSDTF